jgi:hypothetical protein
MMLSAVMPVKLSGDHDADNLGYSEILFASLRHFGVREALAEFLVVVRAREADRVADHARHWQDFPIRIVVEEAVLPAFRRRGRRHARHWYRQQIIKLHCASLVKTPFFLVLDPDVFAVKPFQMRAVMRKDRALLQPEGRAVHERWWLGSAQVLGVNARLDQGGISVTPAILSTRVCERLKNRIEARHGKAWIDVLLGTQADWTEYTLYFLTLENDFGVERFHFWPDVSAGDRLHSAVNVWSRDEFSGRFSIEQFFQPDNPGLFGIIQSSLQIPPRTLADLLRPHFPVTVHPYERLDGRGLRGRRIVTGAPSRSRALRRRPARPT